MDRDTTRKARRRRPLINRATASRRRSGRIDAPGDRTGSPRPGENRLPSPSPPVPRSPLPERYILPQGADIPAPRESLPRHRREQWALCLEARAIPFSPEPGGKGRLFVPVEWVSAAVDEIRAYEEENQTVLPRKAPRQRPGGNADLSIFVAAMGLILIHMAKGRGWTAVGRIPQGPSPDLDLAGMADSARMLAGEWWRAVTALTLHADVAHLAGNVVVGAIFVTLLRREVGAGPAWLLALASGVLGNVVNAYARGAGHLSLGASTAVFGMVGALGAAQAVRNFLSAGRWKGEWKRLILPAAAGLTFLAMLGAGGERTDLGAHLFGFGAGLVLGTAAGFLTTRFGAPSRKWDTVLSLAALAVCGVAWLMALRGSV